MKGRELITERRAERIAQIPSDRLHFNISLDGDEKANDEELEEIPEEQEEEKKKREEDEERCQNALVLPANLACRLAG